MPNQYLMLALALDGLSTRLSVLLFSPHEPITASHLLISSPYGVPSKLYVWGTPSLYPYHVLCRGNGKAYRLPRLPESQKPIIHVYVQIQVQVPAQPAPKPNPIRHPRDGG